MIRRPFPPKIGRFSGCLPEEASPSPVMGSVVGEKVALAFELAFKQKQPIVAVATGS